MGLIDINKIIIDQTECEGDTCIGSKVFLNGKQIKGVKEITTHLDCDGFELTTLTFHSHTIIKGREYEHEDYEEDDLK